MSQKVHGKIKRGPMRDIDCSKNLKGRLSNIEQLKTRLKEPKKQLNQQRESEMQKIWRKSDSISNSNNISKQ